MVKTYNKLDIALYELMRKRFNSAFESLGASTVRLKLFHAQNSLSNVLLRPAWRRLWKAFGTRKSMPSEEEVDVYRVLSERVIQR